MSDKSRQLDIHRMLTLWPGSDPSNVYRELIKLSVNYTNNNKTPEAFVSDFFGWCGVDYEKKNIGISWPDAIDICTSYLVDDYSDKTFH